jgi:hypothetical protein
MRRGTDGALLEFRFFFFFFFFFLCYFSREPSRKHVCGFWDRHEHGSTLAAEPGEPLEIGAGAHEPRVDLERAAERNVGRDDIANANVHERQIVESDGTARVALDAFGERPDGVLVPALHSPEYPEVVEHDVPELPNLGGTEQQIVGLLQHWIERGVGCVESGVREKKGGGEAGRGCQSDIHVFERRRLVSGQWTNMSPLKNI